MATTNVLGLCNPQGMIAIQPIRQAKLHILIALMLNSYRHRRKEIISLIAQVENLRKTKNSENGQLNFYQSMFEKERKANEELRYQLRTTNIENSNLKSEVEKLKNTLGKISLKLEEHKKEAQQIEEDFHKKLAYQEALLAKAKSQLCDLKCQYNTQKANAMAFKAQAVSLSEQNHRHESEIISIKQKMASIVMDYNDALTYIKELEGEMMNKTEHLKGIMKDKSQLNEKNDQLADEITKLRHRLDVSVGTPLKEFWKKTAALPKGSVSWLHWFAYSLLPGVPAPSTRPAPLPFGFHFGKLGTQRN